jgi:hypothetical protein
MQSPELLLAGLNSALRDLRAAAQVHKPEQIAAALLPVMRRRLVAEVVGRTWILAIGGSQSAGKTTLVRIARTAIAANAAAGLVADSCHWCEPCGNDCSGGKGINVEALAKPGGIKSEVAVGTVSSY